jgi:hypothetical protein
MNYIPNEFDDALMFRSQQNLNDILQDFDKYRNQDVLKAEALNKAPNFVERNSFVILAKIDAVIYKKINLLQKS